MQGQRRQKAGTLRKLLKSECIEGMTGGASGKGGREGNRVKCKPPLRVLFGGHREAFERSEARTTG